MANLLDSLSRNEITNEPKNNKLIKTLFVSPETTNNNSNYKERKAKNKETENRKNCNPNFKPMRAFAFFGGLVAILNGLCSLTAAGSAIVTAYICCSRSCCCRCCSNNIKYTYTYNLPWAAPRWEVVQGLWRPKQANELRALDEPTNQKKGQDVLISMYTYTCMHCVCACVGAGTYACVLVTVSPEENNAYFRFYIPTL